MPRSMWKGAISFGLVTIPVAVYPATEEKTLKFNQLHDEDMGRIRYKRMCEKDGEIVDFDHIVKGYEYDKDRYVVLTDEDFDKVPVESSRAIDIQQFVDLEEIDPMMYKKSYYLIPEETGAKAYALLREAMSQDNKVGIAKVSFRDKEHLAALRFSGDAFVLETMYWPDELREADFGGTKVDHKVRGQELEMARQLIANLTADWNPDEYTDDYREAMLTIVEAKINGEEIETVEAEPTAKVVDLMEALKASVAAAKKRADDGEDEAPARPAREEDRRQEVLGQEVHGEEVDREEDDGTQEGRRRVIEGLPAGVRARPATRADLAGGRRPVPHLRRHAAGRARSAQRVPPVDLGAALRRPGSRHRALAGRRRGRRLRPGHLGTPRRAARSRWTGGSRLPTTSMRSGPRSSRGANASATIARSAIRSARRSWPRTTELGRCSRAVVTSRFA